MKGFLSFIREQGVMGLAVGFILGGAISKVVSSLVTDIVNPLVGILLGFTANLQDASFWLAGSEIMWGHFLAVLIDFAIIAAVVYFGVHGLGLDKLDKPKEPKEKKK
ncbi:MAG: large-conductance mechanosensitive channel [uncultured bacterium]|uniref:Mechanosensitive ion channel protein MscL n=1 Tax=Candidatus Collierbacteria bacterium RIFOXYA2_FULL_46_10 TaxID=1817726 RepID=A0A1F5F6Q7_9BACT|nr:MAG: large-conductance mechanosensitive channel [uncultured bacterium]KKU21673.1 MAG: Large-conductance mechanosensitive channel-like protein [Microgenomates group bacterium GW2011_GWF1_46_12]KKU26822.1 MAG: Large-conductance mechanosensitive channel-like protein [Microgenomates group bacterium GW2011_GWC1_46_16]KKU28238.1 MAG: Large-conductance mechanosensitive channel-like protein [Microgenomates group bacterium GW2011_GWF2_46_18]KKU42740.1 MAG: Large-conductance mechanosensitive channel-l